MKKDTQAGFAVVETLLVVAIIGLIGFTGWFALHARQSANDSLQQAASSSPAVNTSSSTKSDKLSPVSQTSASPASTAAPSSTTKSGSKQSTATTSNSSQAPASSPAPTQTTLSVLTDIITNLEKGVSAKVTANSVTVPGPISDAHARPLVFNVSGQTYFAYTQGTPPNFNTTPGQTAGSMAIVKATVTNPSLIDGYLDKSNNLTDANFHSDGYSTGGN